MNIREKNKIIGNISFLLSNNYNRSETVISSSESKMKNNDKININKISKQKNKSFCKRSYSYFQNKNISKNSKKQIEALNIILNNQSELNRICANTNLTKENLSIKIENNDLMDLDHQKYKSIDDLKTSKANNKTKNNKDNNIKQIINYRSLSPSPKEIMFKKKINYLLPEKTSDKKTLVLDLDETLVHSIGEGAVDSSSPSDFTIQVEQQNSSHDVHVMVRPHVEEFLERMSKRYELVIFTASISKYANPLLNVIDKTGNIPFRLFREHCTLINTAFIKDLSLLGRKLKDIIILDNNPTAYALNHYNGFPIKSWFDDKKDNELIKISPILEFLSYVPDVRDYIKKIVVHNKVQFDMVKQVIVNYNNNLKKNIIPPECKKIFDLFNNDKNNNLNSSNNFDKIIQKSKSTKISIIKPSFSHGKKYFNTKINNFTNINIINKSTNYNRIFNFGEKNNNLFLSLQKPTKLKNLNINIIKSHLKKKEILNNKNTFLKKKNKIMNTMRYNYSINKIHEFIINNINNININISNNNCSYNKNNFTENINSSNLKNINNNSGYCEKTKKIFFNNNSNLLEQKRKNYNKKYIIKSNLLILEKD